MTAADRSLRQSQTDPCDSQFRSYPVNIPVQAGDIIGVYVVNNWEGSLRVLARHGMNAVVRLFGERAG